MTRIIHHDSPAIAVRNGDRGRWELRFGPQGLVPDYRHLLWQAGRSIGIAEEHTSRYVDEEGRFCLLFPYTDDGTAEVQRQAVQRMLDYLRAITLLAMSLDDQVAPLDVAVVRQGDDYQVRFSSDTEASRCWGRLERGNVGHLGVLHTGQHRQLGDDHGYISFRQDAHTVAEVQSIVEQFLQGEGIIDVARPQDDWDDEVDG